MTEEELREALQLAQQHVASLVQAQLELAERVGKRKRKVQLLGATPEAERLVMVRLRTLAYCCGMVEKQHAMQTARHSYEVQVAQARLIRSTV